MNISLEPKDRGWLILKLNDYAAQASYLDDVPIDWLKSIHFSIANHLPLTLRLDEEGSEVFIVSYNDTVILDNREDIEKHTIYKNYEIEDLSCKKLSRYIVDCIKENLDYFVTWLPESDHYNEEDRMKRKNYLLYLLNKCQAVLK